jgi:Cell Wall Hydrolase
MVGLTDEEALALTVWGEARSEVIEGKIGVAMVIRNRVQQHYRGASSYVEVCLAHVQFSAWTDEWAQMSAEQEMLTGDPTLAHHPDPVIHLCVEIARATMAGTLADNTGSAPGGATHYFADAIPTPAWARGVPCVRLGTQFFLRVA